MVVHSTNPILFAVMFKRPQPPDIEIIATGGFFEKRNLKDGVAHYPNVNESYINKSLSKALGPPVLVTTLFLKDSSNITDDDRRLISEKVILSPLPRIIIVHGTSTLDVTTRFLFNFGLKKTIVLTGTTSGFDDRPEEGLFNLGAAIGLVQALPHGVYGVMNGRIIPPMSLRKDAQSGRFDTASGEHLLNISDRT
ncbi:MAG: asparaginase [Henriciella sp.]|nr:asparaginase [Henriciella sp.]